MKKTLQFLFIVTCMILVSIFGFLSLDMGKGIQTSSAIQAQSAGNISIIKAVTELKRGDIGFITIQGQPGVRYTAVTSFTTGNTIRRVTQWRVADGNGMATFIWNVGDDTSFGTYPLTISGGGKTLNLKHTVLQ